MKKTICGKVYDTDASTLVKKTTSGELGDAAGYEESLYQTETGAYFIYANGGAESAHPAEEIKRMSKVNAEKWLADHE